MNQPNGTVQLRIILLAVLAMTLNKSMAQPTPDSLALFIKTRGDSLYQAEKLPGIFVGVLNNGVTQYFNFGYAVPDAKTPFDSATLFEAGSITKTFTAYILTSLLQEKGIADTVSIIGYLPDSMQSNKALEKITFLSLMNHTSGLPRLPGNLLLSNEDRQPYDHYTLANLFAYLKTAVPAPDGKSNYSNLGMGLAGVLAQHISGKKFTTLLKEYILKPFGISKGDTLMYSIKSQGYFGNAKTPYWNMDALAPAGGLQCTAANMLAYLKNMSRPQTKKAKAIIDQLTTPTVAISPTIHVGRAWHTFEQPGKRVVYWHNGGTYGFSTFAAFVKGTGQAVVVVVNRYNSNKVSDGLGLAIMQQLTTK